MLLLRAAVGKNADKQPFFKKLFGLKCPNMLPKAGFIRRYKSQNTAQTAPVTARIPRFPISSGYVIESVTYDPLKSKCQSQR